MGNDSYRLHLQPHCQRERSRFYPVGWGVCEAKPEAIDLMATSLADNCLQAAARSREAIREFSRWQEREPGVVAAGIDAPLYWGPRGPRHTDDVVRDALVGALQQLGLSAGSAPGTVQIHQQPAGSSLGSRTPVREEPHSRIWSREVSDNGSSPQGSDENPAGTRDRKRPRLDSAQLRRASARCNYCSVRRMVDVVRCSRVGRPISEGTRVCAALRDTC